MAKWKTTQRVYVNGLGYEKGETLPDGVEPYQWQIDRGQVVAAEKASSSGKSKKG